MSDMSDGDDAVAVDDDSDGDDLNIFVDDVVVVVIVPTETSNCVADNEF